MSEARPTLVEGVRDLVAGVPWEMLPRLRAWLGLTPAPILKTPMWLSTFKCWIGSRIGAQTINLEVLRPDETIPWWSQGNLVVEAHGGPSGIEVQIIEGDGFLPQLGLVVLHLRRQSIRRLLLPFFIGGSGRSLKHMVV